ncbi:Aldo/keto reductase [Cryphonectria parasitica EP155]|uniref:Aldo/keto reductase n=1 Tax=Cryphonectria parasitica (strain ATCC 38755 / EP155) TaxID=660469 RepID=A0A9P4Y2P2_CRYP1|nr:Aldo/keto reductase [Cryphonectria parasitica EP155]KAF3765340.1 Aldo/keto reductase [Cryphonectria parasitica EP155]
MAPPVSLPTRKLGRNGPEVTALGLGLMGLSNAYGDAGTDEERFKFLDRAWELGCTFWDSSDLYGDSEDLLGKWFKLHPERRADIFLATKFGIVRTANGYGMDTSPEYCRAACEKSLQRLGIDSIDLYYIHRLDEKTPIEKTVEVLAELKREGKIKYLGISECSSTSLRRAHAVHPIAAVQVEYNPWDLDIENETGTHLLPTCRELGVATIAYSPLGRGILTGQIRSRDDLGKDDFRLLMSRWSEENFPKNLAVVDKIASIAARKGVTTSQLGLAWVLKQGDDLIPIPGTKKIKYLEENLGALKVDLSDEEEKEIRKLVDEATVIGKRNIPGLLNVFADTPPLQ